ncbi:MAG: DUF1150 domain-containing protein [Hyphomicrobium sp.]|nr:DUF1150 domain-containing protein [Hyphomicrobium sp.]
MNRKSSAKPRARKAMPPIMSEIEFAHLLGGEVAYIKTLSSDQASKMFPMIEGLPKDINLFSLHAADGTPLALTDTIQAAIGHAAEDELSITPLH